MSVCFVGVIILLMKSGLQAAEQAMDGIKETKFCIAASREFIEKEQKQKFLNKLTFDYSLGKINRQKIYGRLIATANALYPRLSYQNGRYAAQQYSSPRIRDNRRSFIQYRKQPLPVHQESIKRYSHILTKKKQGQGGLNSFWMFKRQNPTEDRKTRGKNAAEDAEGVEVPQNGAEMAFGRILAFGKMPIDLESGLVSKNLLKNYIASVIGECFAEWFIKFFLIRSYINLKEFETLGEKFRSMTLRETHLVSFFLYDQNGDNFVCPRDVFTVFERQMDPTIEQDVLQIAIFSRSNEGREEEINEQYKIEHVVIRDDWLTVKDYELYFKKVDEPFLRATNKKDTGFSKTFAVLDHREKVRSTRREINQKKMMYNQLFGEMTRERKNSAYVEQNDYKLNYTFLYEVFPTQPTRLFRFFAQRVLGVTLEE